MMRACCKRSLLLVLFVTAWIPSARTHAQATANALAVAEDAFGSADGAESIGIYGETSVRGFSLEAAENYRINGRYFVNSGVSSFFVEKTIVRVGHNALWLDYPGPSGVVDYRLSAPDFGDSRATLNHRIDQEGFGVTYDLSLPDRFKLGAGILYSDYSKRFTNEVGVATLSDSAPWLYNTSAALMIGAGVELYGSYSRGLEEAGIAPTTAAKCQRRTRSSHRHAEGVDCAMRRSRT